MHCAVQVEPAQQPAHRDGDTYSPVMDEGRLNAQARVVWRAMASGEWQSLAALAAVTGAPEASVSARIRDFRKPEFGGHEVERRRRDASAAWEYRLRVRVHSNA